MSWLNLNQSLNSLKGQITNFATEVLSEGIVEDSNETFTELERANVRIHDLDDKCKTQELEIAALKKLNDELQTSLQTERLSRKNGIANHEEDSSWFWDPPSQTDPHGKRTGHPQNDNQYILQIQALQDEIAHLKRCDQVTDEKQSNSVDGEKHQILDDELNRLREENNNLTANLEDLDNQHQLAMERLLTLKKELQKNFEVLKQEHEDLKNMNDDYSREINELKAKLLEKDKELELLVASKVDYDTLQHKYINLERVHSILRETAEKFQEENLELHEEIIKLQEELTKNHQDAETTHELTEHSDNSLDVVPRVKYEEILKELFDLRDTRRSTDTLHLDETNIDDNAKSVIENLKRDITDLKHKLAHKNEDTMEATTSNCQLVDVEKLSHLYTKYVNFDLPVDFVGEMTASSDSNILYKVETAFKTLNTFKKEIDILAHKLSEKSLNQNHLQTQIDDLTTENDFLTSDLGHYERELSEMKKNNDFLIAEIASLKNVSKLEPIIETHEDNLAKLESELADCTKINKSFESEIRTIEKQLLEVNNDKVLLQSDLNDLRDKYNHMMIELDTFRSKTTAVQQLEIVAQNEEMDKLQKATDDISDLQRKLLSTNSKNEQLSIDNHIIENEKVLLTNQLDETKHLLEEKESTHRELETLKTLLEHKLQELERKHDNVIRDKAGLESYHLTLIEKLKLLTMEANSLAHGKECSSNLKRVEHEADKYISEIESKLHDYKNKDEELKLHVQELENLKSTNSKIEEKMIILDDENSRLTKKLELQNQELDYSRKREKELVTEISKLHDNSNLQCENKTHYEQEISELKSKLQDHEVLSKELEGLRTDKHHLLGIKNQLENDLAITDEKLTSFDSKFEQLVTELKAKKDEIDNLNAIMEGDKICIVTLNDTISRLKNTVDVKDQEIILLNQSLQELNERLNLQSNNNPKNQTESNDTIRKDNNILERKISELENLLATKETELDTSLTRVEDLEKAQIEKKTMMDNMTAEKSELINLITMKHNENIQYHNEIQRLNHIILEHTTEYKKVLDERDLLLKSHTETLQNCLECEKLKHSLKEKDERIMNLNQTLSGADVSKAELANATDLIRNLTERCENLDKSLTIQLDTVKKLTAENSKVGAFLLIMAFSIVISVKFDSQLVTLCKK